MAFSRMVCDGEMFVWRAHDVVGVIFFQVSREFGRTELAAAVGVYFPGVELGVCDETFVGQEEIGFLF